MNSFSKSLLNRLLTAVLALLTILFLFQAAVSYIIYKSKPAILNYLNTTFKYRFSLEDLSLNFLKGVHIKEASIFYRVPGKPAISVKDAFISIKILPLILKRTLAFKININEAICLLSKETEGINLQIIISDIYKKAPSIKSPIVDRFKNKAEVSVKTAKFFYTGNSDLEKNMFFLIKNLRVKQEEGKIKFDGNIDFNYRFPKDAYISRFFKNKRIKLVAGCSVQGYTEGKDLVMDLIIFNWGKNQIIGKGITKDFMEKNPYLDINFVHSAVLLDNIAAKKDYFNAAGSAFFSLKVNGPMDEAKPSIACALLDCNFRSLLPGGESFAIKKLNAEFKYSNGEIYLDKTALILNNIPLNIKLTADITDEPNLALDISLPKEFLVSQKLPLDRFNIVFNGQIRKTLVGNLNIQTSYIRKGRNLDMRAYFKNIEFDYNGRERKSFKADSIQLIKDNALKIQKLNFSNLESQVSLAKDSIEMKELKFRGYNALLDGVINLEAKDKTSLTFLLEGEGLDVKTLMQDINISDKLLSGVMNMKVIFDNKQKEFLKGECYIKDGAANLGIIADIIALPSLKNTDFEMMSAKFLLSKEIIRVNEIKLISPDISLDGFWDTNGKIEGKLSLKIASQILNQSKTFKRLLALTRIKKPCIDFDFLLGGIPDTVRIMWMKGEFKDKIKQGLPAWVKRRIENSLDKMIDGQ